MKTFSGLMGQSLYDVCLFTYGSLDNLLKLCQDNGIGTVNDSVLSNQQLVYDDTLVVNPQVNQNFLVNGNPYCTHGPKVFQTGSFLITEDGFFIISETGQKLKSE